MMGMGSGMMARHHATIPGEYAGLSNPIEGDETAVSQGAALYATHCATCHGESGAGDGPASAGLDPSPAPLVHTARMLADDYLFWRVSEGGTFEPFNSAMPAWKAALDEQARWQVISYLRVLAGGLPAPGPMTQAEETARRAEMLAEAQDQGLITAEEAALFDDLHARMDALLAEETSSGMSMLNAGEANLLNRLVEQGEATEEQIRAFNDIHDRLLNAGLMR